MTTLEKIQRAATKVVSRSGLHDFSISAVSLHGDCFLVFGFVLNSCESTTDIWEIEFDQNGRVISSDTTTPELYSLYPGIADFIVEFSLESKTSVVLSEDELASIRLYLATQEAYGQIAAAFGYNSFQHQSLRAVMFRLREARET